MTTAEHDEIAAALAALEAKLVHLHATLVGMNAAEGATA